MKRITTIFALLIMMCMSTWATVTQPTLTTDPDNPTYYVIQSVRSGKYANFAGASAQLTQVETASAGVSTLWYFMANGDGVSIVPAADPTLKLASTTSATADGAVWYTPENPYNAGTFCVSLTSGATANCWDDQGSHTTIGYWQPSAGDYQGTSWNIVEVSVTKAEVDAGTVDMTFALTKLDVLARLAPLSSLSVYTDANIAAVKNAADQTAMNTALEAFNANISLLCRSGKYLVVGESACSYVESPTGYEEAIQLESAGNGTFYLKGYKSEKYIGDVALSTAIGVDATPTKAFYFQVYNGYTVVRPSDTSASYDGYRYIHNGGSGCVGWEPSAANTQHTIAEVTLPAAMVNVTYHLMYNNTDYAQAVVECGVGDAPAVPAALQYDFTTYTYDVQTIAATTTDVYVTPTFNMPFTASTDYANATWYYLHGHATYSDRYISTNGTATVWGTGKSNTDAYKWAFIGDPIVGIEIINKASGDGYYLANTDEASMSNVLGVWPIKKQTNTAYTNTGGNGFGFYDTSRSQYLNCQGSTIKYWGSFDQGSTFWVEEVPAVTVSVTFNLIVDGNIVNTVVQDDVTGNTTISVPASLFANYSSLAYTYSGADDVNVGTTDLVVNVTATLKDGIVLSTALSNSRAYKLHCERGDLATYTNEGKTYLASPCKTALNITEGKKFAILNYENNLYLYSVDDQKFVTFESAQIAPLAATVTGTSDAVAFTEVSSAVYGIMFDNSTSKYLNSSGSYTYGVVINDWGGSGKWDGGNQYVIYDIENFDPTAALDILDDYFHGTTAFNNAIAELEAINWSSPKGQLNKYNFTGTYAGYAGQEASVIAQVKAAGYDATNLAIVQDMLANYSINLPSAGFYRIKGNTSSKYLAAENASNGKYNMSDATDATTIFYFDDTKLTNFGSGMSNGMSASSWNWVLGADASTVEFQDGLTNGGYAIKSANANFYDNGDNSASADRGGNLTISTSTNARYTSWYLETVDVLPVKLNDIAGTFYATLCLPVDVTLSPEANAYTIAVNAAKDEAAQTMIAIETDQTTKIPANTPVVLEGTASSVNATINTTGTAFAGLTVQNDLTGTLAAIDVTNSGHYFLGKGTDPTSPNGVVPGFFHWQGTTLKAFRAYLDKSKVDGNPSKGLTLVDGEATGINGINAEQADGQAIYNLQGQRVNKAQRGIYIVGGRKVVVK